MRWRCERRRARRRIVRVVVAGEEGERRGRKEKGRMEEIGRREKE